jgi:hypothetical protein
MRLLPSCVILVAASQLGATDCGGFITRDPGFDLWCGKSLCAWKLASGEVRRAATWHADDAGVELLAQGTAIEQFTPVDSRDGTCIRFDLVSDVEESAQAELLVDVYGDGTNERSFAIPTSRWKPVSFSFTVAPPFTGIRFEIAKRGAGRAVVARMRAAVVRDGCPGIPPLFAGPAPLAALCDTDSGCVSGVCAAIDLFSGHGRCAGCDPFEPVCAAGQVCGLADPGPPERPVPVACVPAAARVLGEECMFDGECATGLCTFGSCSTCDPEAAAGAGACSTGVACQPAYGHGPSLCGAGQGRAARGAPCAIDGDCASGACTGPERRQCEDGRACATDDNCPADINLKPGPCTTVGIQGGRCD